MAGAPDGGDANAQEAGSVYGGPSGEPVVIAASPVPIALVQLAVGPSPPENVATAVARIRDAASHGARIVVLPELFASQYFCQEENPAYFDLAEPLDGPTGRALAAAARASRAAVVGSLFERRAPGVYHNTLVVYASDGSLAGVYRKMHIPDDPRYYEKFYFTPGDLGFVAVRLSALTLGPLVCWDQWYPEAARLTALRGAELLVYPSAIGWHPDEKAEHGAAQYDAWVTMHRAHAIANGVYVAAVNRVGLEHAEVVVGGSAAAPLRADGPGLEFWGGSFVADPFGRMVARASHERPEIVYATIDPSLVETTRRHWPFLRDRRVDAYGSLTERYLDRT